ncbi:hypothetical protein DPMN_101440 [Dreissena polymorpha]|uniref:Uncharacterized protein n=1 Tax=Dreissena polymorpha TaxID=45954 RepID=A0A9D4LJC7_DREPO|nr:hypothetical protein DPMN_101440 [Dreissena polymorpha]
MAGRGALKFRPSWSTAHYFIVSKSKRFILDVQMSVMTEGDFWSICQTKTRRIDNRETNDDHRRHRYSNDGRVGRADRDTQHTYRDYYRR